MLLQVFVCAPFPSEIHSFDIGTGAATFAMLLKRRRFSAQIIVMCARGVAMFHSSAKLPKKMHPEFVLWNLTAVAFARHGNRALTQATALSMLRRRQCTNEEDRVLGVLGLLRDATVGKSQLRTGQSMKSQLWQLHRAAGQGLLKLCMMDVAGCAEVGMSWAPACLINDDQLPGISSFNFSLKGDLSMPILQSAMVLRTFAEGPTQGLFLVASILSGYLDPGNEVIPCKRVNPRCHRLHKVSDVPLLKVESIFTEGDGHLSGLDFNGEHICGECSYHSQNCKHLIRRCGLVLLTSKEQALLFSLAAHEGGCGQRSTVEIRNCNTAEEAEAGEVHDIDFRMVLTGVASVSRLKPFCVHLVNLLTTRENVFGLVCITSTENSREVFHKIGTFSCPLHQDPFPQSNRSCLIGGFGNDVSEYVCH
ncbi:hypothetical protein L7F22_004598 [Adiantum nelumboides]|nr:hypothetical protein [Adiantum nelumboides]